MAMVKNPSMKALGELYAMPRQGFIYTLQDGFINLSDQTAFYFSAPAHMFGLENPVNCSLGGYEFARAVKPLRSNRRSFTFTACQGVSTSTILRSS